MEAAPNSPKSHVSLSKLDMYVAALFALNGLVSSYFNVVSTLIIMLS